MAQSLKRREMSMKNCWHKLRFKAISIRSTVSHSGSSQKCARSTRFLLNLEPTGTNNISVEAYKTYKIHCLSTIGFLAAFSLLIFWGLMSVCLWVLLRGFLSSESNHFCLLCFFTFEFLLFADYCKFWPPLLYRLEIFS